MAKPSALVIDRYHKWGDRVRDQLSRQGFHAHIVCTSHGALAFARSKQITAAVLEPDVDPPSGALWTELQNLGVQSFYSHTGSQLNQTPTKG
jgi:hypothetical protein